MQDFIYGICVECGEHGDLNLDGFCINCDEEAIDYFDMLYIDEWEDSYTPEGFDDEI